MIEVSYHTLGHFPLWYIRTLSKMVYRIQLKFQETLDLSRVSSYNKGRIAKKR